MLKITCPIKQPQNSKNLLYSMLYKKIKNYWEKKTHLDFYAFHWTDATKVSNITLEIKCKPKSHGNILF